MRWGFRFKSSKEIIKSFRAKCFGDALVKVGFMKRLPIKKVKELYKIEKLDEGDKRHI